MTETMTTEQAIAELREWVEKQRLEYNPADPKSDRDRVMERVRLFLAEYDRRLADTHQDIIQMQRYRARLALADRLAEAVDALEGMFPAEIFTGPVVIVHLRDVLRLYREGK